MEITIAKKRKLSEENPFANCVRVEKSDNEVKSDNNCNETEQKTFANLGITEQLCQVVEGLGWCSPTPVQQKAIPSALLGRDIIGLAETGSGKTAAFALPIVQHLYKFEEPFTALIVTPTRELALQVRDQTAALGVENGLRCVCVVGGVDFADQALELSESSPHVVVGTPGRLVDHMENSECFKTALGNVKFFVLDEADRLLNSEFEIPIERILNSLPKKRQTMLFSATMTNKVAKLQKMALVNPLRVTISAESATVAALHQCFLLVPRAKKDCALLYLLREDLSTGSVIVFVDACREAQRLALTLRYLGAPALPLHGRMTQKHRVASLAKFRAATGPSCLVATDVASRGLDIPNVDVVLNYNVPLNRKDYVHRVGRTARAGRKGQAVTLVTQYDVGTFQLLEETLGKKMEAMEVESKGLEQLWDSVRRADVQVRKMLSEEKVSAKRRRVAHFNEDDDDEEEERISAKQKTLSEKEKKKI